MAIDLKPEQQRLIDMAAHIEEGFAQGERGELMDGDVVVAMLHRRRTARLNPQMYSDFESGGVKR
jgi:hypothetical protein